MATSLAFNDLLAAAEEQYGSLILELPDGEAEVELVPALRLSKEKRKALGKITDDTGEDVPEEDRADTVDVFHRWCRLVAFSDEQADRLIARVGDRLDIWKVLQTDWSDRTSPGEVSPSES